ncbi:hypothetical protein, partial [Ascidiimonas aurantiaca]|uniref:hypothetical protein n=1 Tax=Ascidiimonas aurantiaca TaxID=1685432 RepID=UPI0030EE40BA
MTLERLVVVLNSVDVRVVTLMLQPKRIDVYAFFSTMAYFPGGSPQKNIQRTCSYSSQDSHLKGLFLPASEQSEGVFAIKNMACYRTSQSYLYIMRSYGTPVADS